MIIRTILFFVLMYFLVKFISRLFLPSSSNNRRNSGFFYRNFGQYYEEGKQQSQNRRNNSSDRFREIEEAEYEDITENSNSSSKSSD